MRPSIGIWLLSFVILMIFSKYDLVLQGGATVLHLPDDHMITQRVALNFFNYGQPYFNPGEAVAANTSLFWPILLSAIYIVASPEAALWVVLVFSCALSAGIVAWAVRTIEPGPARAAGLALLLFSPGMLTYGGSGWEHVPQMACVTAAFLPLLAQGGEGRPRLTHASMVWLSLSFLFRPDSAPLIAAYAVPWLRQNLPLRPARTVALSAALATIPLAYVLLMLHFYGEIVPNTLRLKSFSTVEALESGLRYLANLRYAGIFPVLFLLALLHYRWLRQVERILLGIFAVQIGYVLYVGGDTFPAGRFFFLILPVMVVIVVRLLVRVHFAPLHRVVGSTGALLVAGLAVVWAVEGGFVGWPPYLRAVVHGRSHDYVGSQILLAAQLKRIITPEDGSIGLHWLGIAYHLPDFHVVDFLGKAEPHIAAMAPRSMEIGHNKWDYDYAFREYRIAAVLLHAGMLDWIRAQPPEVVANRVDYQIALGAKLLAEESGYTYVAPGRLGLPSNLAFGVFLRDDLLDRLEGG